MRTLTSTEKTAQKSRSRKPKVKVVLSSAGQDTRTYEENVILSLVHTEEADTQTAQLLVDNSDGALTSLDLYGYKAVISWGFTTTNGAEYSDPTELYVVGQQLLSSQGRLQCMFALGGIPNLLEADKASGEFTPDEDDSDTVKTLIRKVAGDTGVTILSVYNHTTSYDVVFDSEDSLIDSYNPADSFSIHLNDSRLLKIKQLLSFTKCVMRVEDDGKIHILVPTISTSTAWQASTSYSLNDTIVPTTLNDYEYICTTAGTSDSSEPTWPTGIGDTVADNDVVWTVSYDYEFSLAGGEHTFFGKSYRKRLVIPNYIVVSSLESQSTPYTGFAEETASSDFLEIRRHYRYRVASNQECTDIATAILSQFQKNAEKGHASAPIHIGLEVHDFVKVTDSRQNDFRAGNIGFIRRSYRPRAGANGEYNFEFRFGKLTLAGLLGTVSPAASSGGEFDIQALIDLINSLMAQLATLTTIVESLVSFHEFFAAYIYITGSGDVVINPKINRRLHLTGDLSMSSGEFFGLLLASTNGVLHWYDNSGARDHTFGPETTGHGKLGNSVYKWLEATIQKAYHDTRLKIPVGTDMYD